jgi:hypothetical protein
MLGKYNLHYIIVYKWMKYIIPIENFRMVIQKHVTFRKITKERFNPCVRNQFFNPLIGLLTSSFHLVHIMLPLWYTSGSGNGPQVVFEYFSLVPCLLKILVQVSNTEPMLCIWEDFGDCFDEALKIIIACILNSVNHVHKI